MEIYDEDANSYFLQQYDSQANLVCEYPGIRLSDVDHFVCGNKTQGWYDLRSHEPLRVYTLEKGFKFLSWQE